MLPFKAGSQGSRPTEWQYDIGSFNGYWDWTTLNDITDYHGDSSITAGDGWVALFNHDINKYNVSDWRWASSTQQRCSGC